jgi:tetratricopeptide (TPR) repeat protein
MEETIRRAREVVDAHATDDPDRAGWLNYLGVCLRFRFLRTGAMADLGEAIRIGREAIDLTPTDHPDWAMLLNNLGTYLGNRYSRMGAMADLEEAIRVGREAIDATPLQHPNRAMFLNNLGAHLGYRYARMGAMADLEEAIRVGREAIDATPLQHPNRAMFLSNLGFRLGYKYAHTGAMADLEEAIRVGREAINATPLDHLDRAGRLNNLGNHLGDRYSRTGAMADLEEAVRAGREAVDATPLDHPDRAGWLSNLGIRLGDRFSRTGTMADLDEAIRVGREAIDATPSDHLTRPTFLNSLGAHLGYRYAHTGAMTDLEEAIRVGQEALDATPLHHPNRARMLNNHGNHLGYRYSRTGAMADLEDAIRAIREAIDASPLDHSNRPVFLSNLGIRLGDRYSRIGSRVDFKEAKECFVTALRHPASPVSVRVAAGRRLLSSPAILQDRQAYAIAKTTIDLIPLLTPRSLQNSDKRHLLSDAVGLSSDAAAIALHGNRGPAAAIELLETGRGVIAGSLFEQSDLAALEREHPDLARSFIDLRDQLDAPSPADSLAIAERPTAATETEGDRHREAGPQLAALLETIRSKSRFERFLLSTSEADMLEAARPGPVVVINVSSYRCDALLIEESGIRLLELLCLSQDALNEHVRELGTLDTLRWLWDVIVCPILDALGFTGPPSDSQWPHVWWVPTGTLTRFPLHAAGHHLRRTGETAIDRVVSSYASSVKAIIHSRRRPQQAPLVAAESRHIVVVAMQNTPQQKPLRHASDEVKAVVDICDSMELPHDRPRSHKSHVLSALEACQIFHFAGHGSTHPTEPLQSKLLLNDWDREPFTVASLLETNLSSRSPFLAYLSACGTGQIRHEKSVDESIHLTSAFQLAGFRHVVGTLWEVDDELCVRMAKLTYEFLRDNGISDESVSSGLHHATRQLRDGWVHQEANDQEAIRHSVSTRVIEKCESTESSKPLWVPYVHYGV